ncbi:tyrosine--tRNA ligase [Candidatus Woesearchaeota archaeon]|nr:tyrosine--tRNA ligase [Candidatus Woesearchaeota archaeon]
MDTDKKISYITRNTEEVLTPSDLHNYISQGYRLKHYIGFEVSGKLHIGSGIMAGLKIADFQKAGVRCHCFLATWHAWINRKLSGDLSVIRSAAGYFTESLKASVSLCGGDPERVSFVRADDLYHNNDLYWQTVIDIARRMTLKRALRSTTIMGRKESDVADLASLFYTPMQVADIFIQDISLAHSGIDQRKAHILAREVASRMQVRPLLLDKRTPSKPLAVHHHLLLGLQAPPAWPVPASNLSEALSEMKMSKSNPSSAVFIHDDPSLIHSKLRAAFCPEGVVSFNPILDWIKHLVFTSARSSFNVSRPDKFGGDIVYESFLELESDFKRKQVHPLDLKTALADYLSTFLEPARKHFQRPKMRKLREHIDSLSVTR